MIAHAETPMRLGRPRDFLKNLMRSDDVAFWRRRAMCLLLVVIAQSLLIGILATAAVMR